MIHLDERPWLNVDLWQQIQAVIRRLPVLADKQPLIRQAAAWLAAPACSVEDTQRYPPRGDKAAIRELNELAMQLKAAMDRHKNLSAEAFQALCEVPPGPEIGLDIGDWPLIDILAGLREQALLAKANLDAKSEKKGGGRPPDYQAADVAVRALGCYEMLTGKDARVSTREVEAAGYKHDTKYVRGGPFVRFLTDVYEVLGIEASVEHQARTAIKERPIGRAIFWAASI